MNKEHIAESDELAAHMWRLAQANRMIRWANEQRAALGDDWKESAEAAAAFEAMLDDRGQVVPESIDLDLAQRGEI